MKKFNVWQFVTIDDMSRLKLTAQVFSVHYRTLQYWNKKLKEDIFDKRRRRRNLHRFTH